MDLTGLVEKRNRSGTVYYENEAGTVIAKKCRGYCGETLGLDSFNRTKRNLGGRSAKCRLCDRERSKKWREENRDYDSERKRKWYEENREYMLEYSKRWHEENREYVRDRHKKWYEENRENKREYNQRWYEENSQHQSEYKKKWRKENRRLTKVQAQRRRARKNRVPDTLTAEQLDSITERFRLGCALTGSNRFHLDHVIPLATGHGGTIYENMIPLRADLNISKSDRCIFDWFSSNRERFNLSQTKFDELIEYLADINGMTTEEYEEYVRWCHANPRTLEELETKSNAS